MSIKKSISNWRVWVRGILGAVIGGGANAVTVMLVKPESFNFNEGWPELWHFTLISALVSMALYLKTHPIPDETS